MNGKITTVYLTVVFSIRSTVTVTCLLFSDCSSAYGFLIEIQHTGWKLKQTNSKWALMKTYLQFETQYSGSECHILNVTSYPFIQSLA